MSRRGVVVVAAMAAVVAATATAGRAASPRAPFLIAPFLRVRSLFLFSYPPLPLKRKIIASEIGGYTEQLLKDHDEKCPENATRLIADLKDQSNVRLHVMYLQSLINVGARVTQVRRCAELVQSNWMERFVLDNTEKRNKARNSFEKNFFKLKINSQVRKRERARE